MTPEQLTTLRNAIATDPAANALFMAGDRAGLADYYNAEASPEFWVWRTSLLVSEIFDGFIADDWTAMDNLTVGQDRIWVNLKEVGSLKPSSAAHRAALTECWKGTAAKVAVKDRILSMGKRKSLRIERLFVTGTGSQANPGELRFEGSVTPDLFIEV